MSSKVVQLRPAPPARGDRKMRPRMVPRVISHVPGLSDEDLRKGLHEHEELILKHEARLTTMIAKILVDHLPPIEDWVAAVLITPPEDGDGDLVELAPRPDAIEIAEPWPSIHKGLKEPPLADRLDVIVEARDVIALVSFDVEPALPVTRRQAEAANLPAHLLFARGEAFAALGEEPANEESLREAFLEHRNLLEENSDELLDHMRRLSSKTKLADAAGVVLALGPDGNAVSAVTREQSRKLVADKPFLERKLDRGAVSGQMNDGRDILSIPIVVWAKGHVSVQTREVVETT